MSTYRWTADADRTWDDHGQDIADTADLPLQTVEEPFWLLLGLLLAVVIAGYGVVLLIGPGL